MAADDVALGPATGDDPSARRQPAQGSPVVALAFARRAARAHERGRRGALGCHDAPTRLVSGRSSRSRRAGGRTRGRRRARSQCRSSPRSSAWKAANGASRSLATRRSSRRIGWAWNSSIRCWTRCRSSRPETAISPARRADSTMPPVRGMKRRPRHIAARGQRLSTRREHGSRATRRGHDGQRANRDGGTRASHAHECRPECRDSVGPDRAGRARVAYS